MARSGLRFRPPPLDLRNPALRWLLLRAFGPRGTTAPPITDPQEVLATAKALSLAARVSARCPRGTLLDELGTDAADELGAAGRTAAARALQLEGLRRRLLPVARKLGVPLVLLKFAALEAAGHLQHGSRSAGDLDVLVSVASTPALIAALRSAGFTPGDEPEQEHQWPTLFHQGVALELHRHLPGVEVPGRAGAFATADALRAAGALIPTDLIPTDVVLFRPSDTVLAAHLLAHGLAQHGLTPEAYPTLRLLADLSDLGLGTAQDETWCEVARWLPSALSPAEIAAARTLLQRLEAGDAERLTGDAAILLAHLLAGTFDPTYRSALKLRLFTPPLSERSHLRAFGAFLRRTVWLSDAQIDDIYGQPKSRWGYFARRWLRPWDLALRSGKALRAWRQAR